MGISCISWELEGVAHILWELLGNTENMGNMGCHGAFKLKLDNCLLPVT